MKSLTIVILLASFGLLSSCQKGTVIKLTTKASLELPETFVAREVEIQPGVKIYAAKSNQDELAIFIQKINEIDSNSLANIREINQKNIQKFMEPFGGRMINSSEKMVNGVLLSSFNFEYENANSSFANYGCLFVQDHEIVIISYLTKKPVSEISLKAKEYIFNSIRIK